MDQVINNEETQKTIKRLSSLAPTVANEDNLSLFQKTILVYKKKKLFNQILQKKVIDLKKKIR